MNNPSDQVALNAASKLDYHDPADVLRKFRDVEKWIVTSNASNTIKHLRTNGLKRLRECREAALFCYGMSQRTGQAIRFSPDEAADYDFTAMWAEAGTEHFAQVQLKELVPKELNSSATIDNLLARLTKYRSNKLTVVIHLNRAGRFEPFKLSIPRLHVAALWFLWGAAPGGSTWCLFGDALGMPTLSSFSYPE